jgi:leader peptidase (prepilin peptidase) / N-methyltransferase
MELLQQIPALLIAICILLGLTVGSFLNVVIYRLPVMMHAEWRRDSRAFLELDAESETDVFNLSWPNSHCPSCQSPLKAWQNIPVLSYVLLRGRCHQCGTGIALRYPLVELLTGLISAVLAWHFGYGWPLAFGLLLSWALIAMSFIDLDQQLLPDTITLPMLWLGLLLSVFDIYVDSHASIIGAACGYLSLWTVYQVFKLVTGKEGMGFGDFKLLALLGAWEGWQMLPMIILLSSLAGAVVGIAMIASQRQQQNQPMPFGPYLAIAGWIALLWGEQINQWYFQLLGG